MSPQEGRVDWAVVAAHVLHPRKVEIIESLACIGRPLAVTDWIAVLGVDDELLTHQQINHHVVQLASQGLLAAFDGQVNDVQGGRRVARRTYYTFAPEVLR